MSEHPPIELLSVVVPAYNEATGIIAFHDRLSAVLKGLSCQSEIIFVNDGSKDKTMDLLRGLFLANANIRVVDLSRNFGKEIAMTAGLDRTTGDAVVLIDADLQDPPEIIPELMKLFVSVGAEVVYAQRKSRAGETLGKKISAHYFYRIMNRVSGIEIPHDTGDFRLMSRRAVDDLRRLRETHRYMKGLFAWIGYDQVAYKYERDARYAGESKFNYWRLWNFSIEAVTSFSTMPLKLSSYFGAIVAAFAVLYGMGIFIDTLFYGNPVPGYPSLLVIILFLGGLQLVTLGVIGEYLGRVFNEVKARPLYLVREDLITGPATSESAQNPLIR